MPQPDRPLLSLSETAERLGVSTRTVQRWTSNKRIPAPIRPGGEGGRPFWKIRDLDLFIETGGIHAYRRAKRGT